MITRSLVAALVLASAACGGQEDTGGSGPGGGTGGDETTGSSEDRLSDDGTALAVEDGLSCLPVSRCHSFANQDCTLVDGNGEIQDEALSAGSVERACPGERGVAEGVVECFDYVEISEGCRRRPDLTDPSWPCGRTDTERCAIVM